VCPVADPVALVWKYITRIPMSITTLAVKV
jgi:hypothetical protein